MRPFLDCTGLGAGVEQQEVAGAVRVLGLAHREAGLAEERRLLVAEVAGDGDALDRRRAAASPYTCARALDLGEHRPRHADGVEQLLVPVLGRQVHQHRAAGVGDVGDVQAAVGAAGEVPDDPGVHVAEQQVARLGALARRRRRCRGSSAPSGRRSRWRSAGRSSARKRSWPPSADSLLQIWSVRVSCQTIALCTASPVVRSHTTVVSRWLVMPMPARSSLAMPGGGDGLGDHLLRCAAQTSAGSCSTHPGLG